MTRHVMTRHEKTIIKIMHKIMIRICGNLTTLKANFRERQSLSIYMTYNRGMKHIYIYIFGHYAF